MAFRGIIFSCMLLLLCSLTTIVWGQPSYVYDNSFGVVDISGAENDGTRVYNWTVKYPIGLLCEDLNWVKTIILNITAITSQADLVLAIGTSTEYFGVAVPYDGGMRIPLQEADANGDYTIGTTYSNLGNYNAYSGLSIIPARNTNLTWATTTLEQQYLTDTDFRRSLVPSKDAWEWDHLAPRTTANAVDDPNYPYCYGGAIAENSNELKLRIFGDRVNDKTQITISKNGLNMTVTLTSTWPMAVQNKMWLFMGMDAAVGQQEIFRLSRIDTIDECTTITTPTAPTTAQPSVSPTTVSPTDSPTTPSPTDMPTVQPTTGMPSETPTGSPTTEIPTDSPSTQQPTLPPNVPTTSYPTESSMDMNVSTTNDLSVNATSIDDGITSTLASVSPSVSTTDEDDQGEDLDEDEDEDGTFINDDTLIGGVDNLYIIIGGGVLLLILIVICVVVYFKIKNRTLREVTFDGTDW